MKTTQFQDELTGSEYADIQSFEDLTVRYVVDHKLRVPQVYDGPFQRVQGRGLPFNSLGAIAVPVAVLPAGLQGLVQEDELMGEVEKAARKMLADYKAPATTSLEKISKGVAAVSGEELDDDELLEGFRKDVGLFCTAAPAAEGIEVEGRLADGQGTGWKRIDAMRDEMRNRNKPQDLIFLGREIEVTLSGVRSVLVPRAEALKQKPYRTNGEKRDALARGYAGAHTGRWGGGPRIIPHFRVHDEIDLTQVDFAHVEARVMAWGQDVRRQKFALTATKIAIVA